MFTLWPVTSVGVLGGLIAGSELSLPPLTIVFAVVGCLVLSVPVALAMAAMWGVVVAPHGITAPDYAGRRQRVEWPQIARVRPTNLLGLKYLRVFSRDAGPVLWLPLFLTDMPGFRAALLEHADAATPLVDYFARRSAP